MSRFSASRNIILTVFMISTFAIGMTEYVVTGLLTQFAEDLHVNVSTTGLLLSVYAISVAIFGPLLRIATIRLPSKPLLLGLMGLFIISNIIAATAPNFQVLVLSRLLSAVMHAPFFGLCMSIAFTLSTPEKGTRAIAAVQGGLTIAIMLGVPFGSYLGGIFDWRYVFWFVALLGFVSLIGLILVVPNQKVGVTPNLRSELKIFKNRNVLLVLAIIVFGFSGVFTAYTFTEPMLTQIAGFNVTNITIGLFVFGVGAVIGTFASGKIPPHLLTERLMVVLIGLAAVLALFTFLIPFKFIAFIMCFLFGAGTFGTTPILNAKIILAGKEAPSLSGTIAASIFNLANSIGATLSTVFLNVGASFTLITLIASGMILFGLILTFVTHKVEDKSLFAPQNS
ncbi:MFS transporter [Priestia endophytica]|jgi:MFS transporter, DHA1 family, inner membrane transport protein|uniref:Predicted arabinose efflux permease, MFS family n=1 Tax=Priestia endophytica DSM 13796 TaxID=1121089 RepID=A0A1I5Y1G1_9BACI|nr:MFS transporter [Priestia endophytica]KYG31507.1 MFS transporter [Priestia endophytica]MBG9811625.1 MFS transporter [Priestia endophytica]SFQ38072.1 Predicted arabinose efflux permease, MFS family [Priestia endophytica DSM 13796]